MKIKKVISELEKVNDINKYSIDELKEKYLVNEETYNDFIQTYAEFFTNHYMYQLRVLNKYEKIINLLYEGNKRYQNDDNTAYLEDLLAKIKATSEYCNVNGTKSDDIYQSIYLFSSSIMPTSTTSEKMYEESVNSIYNGAVAYDNFHNDSISDFLLNLFYQRKTNSEDRINYIKDYINNHEMMNLCNSKDFLCFSNYMVTHDKKNVDEKFVEDVRVIIKTSKLLQELGFVDENFDKEEYNKLAQFTLKNINKEKRKLEQKEDQAIRKTIKLFKKNSNK